MIGPPSINWQEAKREYDKLVQTDNNAITTIPTERKSLSGYM
jgi:hypothetical protein